MINNLQGQAALVTGGAQGLGFGIAQELANAGASVVIADLNTEAAQVAAKKLQDQGHNVIAVMIDVTDPQSIQQAVKESIAEYPNLSILVNNAGVMQNNLNEQVTAADFDLCYEVNLKGVWAVTQALIPHLKQQGSGKIINIASVAGRRGHSLASAYCASKAAVISLTQSQAEELGPHNINVNAVCPGNVWTPLWETIAEQLDEGEGDNAINEQTKFASFEESIPLRRSAEPCDIGNTVVFFASPQARNITGQSLNVDGGHLMN